MMDNSKVKVKKKKRGPEIFPVVITITTLSAFILLLNGNMPQLMNNSIDNYYCKDDSFKLNGKNCERTIISKPLLLGDVNLDGQLDKEDMDLIKKHLRNNYKFDSIQKLVADVDRNNTINKKDVTKLESYIKNGDKEYICQNNFKYKDKNVCIKIEKQKALRK